MMTLIAPWISRAAPLPATALPRMNTGEFGAAADEAEPATRNLVSSRGLVDWPTFKHHDRTQIHSPCIENSIYFPPGGLEGCDSYQVRRTVPANILEGMKLR